MSPYSLAKELPYSSLPLEGGGLGRGSYYYLFRPALLAQGSYLLTSLSSFVMINDDDSDT